VGFEPEIFCYVGGRDDHYATPSGLKAWNFNQAILKKLVYIGVHAGKMMAL
jgi:hypothetical protein